MSALSDLFWGVLRIHGELWDHFTELSLFAKALLASDARMGCAFAGYPISFTLFVLPLGHLLAGIVMHFNR